MLTGWILDSTKSASHIFLNAYVTALFFWLFFDLLGSVSLILGCELDVFSTAEFLYTNRQFCYAEFLKNNVEFSRAGF